MRMMTNKLARFLLAVCVAFMLSGLQAPPRAQAQTPTCSYALALVQIQWSEGGDSAHIVWPAPLTGATFRPGATFYASAAVYLVLAASETVTMTNNMDVSVDVGHRDLAGNNPSTSPLTPGSSATLTDGYVTVGIDPVPVSLPNGTLCVQIETLVTPTPTSTPGPSTAIPLPTALPTLLPDQTLASLTIHSQAVAQLGVKPAGVGIIALLFLWLGLFWLTKQRM